MFSDDDRKELLIDLEKHLLSLANRYDLYSGGFSAKSEDKQSMTAAMKCGKNTSKESGITMP